MDNECPCTLYSLICTLWSVLCILLNQILNSKEKIAHKLSPAPSPQHPVPYPHLLSLHKTSIMSTSTVLYTKDLRTELTHTLSGHRIITDAPPDNKGRGEAFSPTDLVATALASCMLTIMGIAANEKEFSIDGAKATVSKVMYSDPRRIGEIHIDLVFPKNDSKEMY